MFSPMSSGHDDWSQHDDPPRTAAAGGPLSATDGIATRTPGGSGSGGGVVGIGRKTAKRDVFTGAAGVGGGAGSKGKSAVGSSRLTRAWKGKLAPGAGAGAAAKGGELSSLGSILRRQHGHGQASAATASTAGPSSRKYGAGLPGTTRGPHRGGFGALRGIGGSAATSKGNGKAKALLGGTPDLTAGPLSSGSPWLDDESEPLLPARVPRPRKDRIGSSSTTSLFGGAGSSSSTALPRWREAFRPSAETVDAWLDSWIKRWTVLAIVPSLIVWIWCAMPFPKGSRREHDNGSEANAHFWFFLIFYYGLYCAIGLIYITQLFSLYRLNWWPAALGARKSYLAFWLLSIFTGYAMHRLGLDSLPSVGDWFAFIQSDSAGEVDRDDDNEIEWQRKTPWVGLAFATMAMPALVCFAGLRRSGRQTYRHSLTDTQKTFLDRQLAVRIPASYIRFLWFMATIGIALVALLVGQGYASVYLSTLPHTGLDGTAYVAFWTVNVNVLMLLSHWILEEKVRSRALLFVVKYYYFLVYFIFYRNLFARLRSFDQFALIQLLSSFWVCIWYPFSMTRFCHAITQYFNPQPKSYEEYVESVGLSFYLRNLAQNTTMLAFLGWVSILHFGPNHNMYPFFAFDDQRDPYNYKLTMLGSLAIWASELVSSFFARQICLVALDVDVTNLGLDEMRAYPELMTSVMWTSVRVLMDMLLFLIRLDF